MKKSHLTLVPKPNHQGMMKNSISGQQNPEGRQEKVISLARAIRNNAYRVDCRKLADCLIASMLLGLLR